MENLDLNLKYIRKTSRKIVKNKYLTYFVALFTIFFISESLINSDNITFVKLLFQNNILKVLVFLLIVFIGYFNMTLGFLLLLNFIFVINVPQKVEGFANSFPNLIDKNEILKYQKNYVSTEPEKLKYKSNEEMSKKMKEKSSSENKDNDKEQEKKIKKKFTKNPKNNSITIDNPINLKASEELEKVKKIIKKKKEKNNDETDSETENDETTSLSFRKKKLREELEKLEKDEKEIKDLKDNNDDTIESDIKQKDLDKRLRLQAMKEEETDESSSSSSNSSGSSSSSESSEDSDKDYDEVSLNDARDHVMKKLRNKLKRKYVKGK